MATEEKSNSFLGAGWSFPPRFVKGADSVQMVSEEDDIKESMHILMNTHVGERFLRPDYGCDIGTYVYESMNMTLETYLSDLVRTSILFHDPRIRFESIDINEREDIDGLDIIITYIVRSTNTRSNYVYPFYKDEGSDIK
jgi:phage baseplate assembly protein W